MNRFSEISTATYNHSAFDVRVTGLHEIDLIIKIDIDYDAVTSSSVFEVRMSLCLNTQLSISAQ
jgi:hypothetical protein